MKYVWIVVVVVALVRIDVILRTVEKLSGRFQSAPQEIQPGEIKDEQELIPFGEDKALKQNAKSTFITLIKDFSITPRKEIRERAIQELRYNPTMYNASLDKQLESYVYGLRDLIQQRNKETAILLNELMENLKGENKEMIRRFYSLLMDQDIKEFLSVYPRSKDPSCSIATVLGDEIPEEEKIYEYQDRLLNLNAYLGQDKVDQDVIEFGNVCEMAIRLHIEKITPKVDPNSVPATETPAPSEEAQQ